jgi:hypothetical protein
MLDGRWHRVIKGSLSGFLHTLRRLSWTVCNGFTLE